MASEMKALVLLAAGIVATVCRAEITHGVGPVWVKGRAESMNQFVGFRGDFEAREAAKAVLKIYGATSFRIYLNGAFVGVGPARGPSGSFRVDEWDLSRFVRDGRNALAVEVSADNVNTYCNAGHSAFLCAEVEVDGRPVLSTPMGFKAVDLPRVVKCSRFSFQRGFGEAYRLSPNAWDWRTKTVEGSLPLEPVPSVRTLPRRVAYPKFDVLPFVRRARTEVARDGAAKVPTVRFVDGVGHEGFRGFPKTELECNLYDEIQRIRTRAVEPVADARKFELAAGEGVVLELVRNSTGFFGATFEVAHSGRVILMFDEVLSDGAVSAARLDVANAISWDFNEPGLYRVENFEPNTFKWAHLVSLTADVRVSEPYFREFKDSTSAASGLVCRDAELVRIFEAGRETFAQNAVDVFTDCPSRERAGWLCDSWFTARTSRLLTGNNTLEDLFLENYALADGFDIEDGMLPMCYPADHPNGCFIPNWAMWLVLELDDYAKRGGDRKLIERLRSRLVELVSFLKRYRNAEGLLEKLPSWVFIEWSKCNDLVQDVNYPSNMLWAEMLDAMVRLYGMKEFAAEAAEVRKNVRKQCWTGEWFCDNAIRQADGALKLSGECTETCQYYAFFTGTATPESHPVLWRRLVDEFGPCRRETGKWPNVWPSNAFIGNYLRLELLSRAGLGEQVLKEIRGYFLKMTETTGTLWEHDSPTASCCHGFASYVTVLLKRHVMEVEK